MVELGPEVLAALPHDSGAQEVVLSALDLVDHEAGGEVRGGQVIGETDATAAEPASVGFSPDDLAASFFTNIGISPKSEFQSNIGRPITLVREGMPVQNLF